MSKKSKFLLCSVIIFSLLLSFFKYDHIVSASVTSDCFKPSKGAIWSTYISDDYKTRITDSLKRLFDRCGLDSDDYYIFIQEVFEYQNAPYLSNLCIFPKNGATEQYKAENNIYYNILVWSSVYRTSLSINGLDNINSISFTANTGYYNQGVFYNSDRGYGFGEIRDYGTGSIQASPRFATTWLFIETFNPPFVAPDGYEVVNLPFYSLDVDDFYNWLINNDKIAIDTSGNVSGKIPSYIGVQKLKSFLNFYKEFGSSNTNFMNKIGFWFSYMNIVGQTQDNKAILKNTIDSLYQEYLDYLNGTHAYWPSATKIQERQNIDTVTKDNNTTLITDDNSDTLDISILRDILRGVIAISNNVNDGVGKILGALARLNFVVNVTNDGGVVPAPTAENDINYTDQGNFGIDEIHQYEPLPEAPDIDGDVDFLDYPAVLAQSTNAFFNLLPSDMSALMSAVLVLGVLITKIGR